MADLWLVEHSAQTILKRNAYGIITLAWDIVIGVGIALTFIVLALVWALRPSKQRSPKRHNVGSGGDYADPVGRRGDFGDGGGGSDGGGGGD